VTLTFSYEPREDISNFDLATLELFYWDVESGQLHIHRTEGCTTWAMDWAAEKGHLEVVKFLHEHRTEGCTTNAMDWAAKNGHLEVVQFLHVHPIEGCTSYAMDNAIRNWHLEVVQFLHEHRIQKIPQKHLNEHIARILIGHPFRGPTTLAGPTT